MKHVKYCQRGRYVFQTALLPFSLCVSGCPINVPILDASRVTVQGDGLHQVAVGRQSQFRVTTQSAGDADLKVRVTGESSLQSRLTSQ